MIEVDSRRQPSAALMYRCLSTGMDQARNRPARDSRPIARSLLRGAGSTRRDRPAALATPSTASQTADQRSSATSRQHPNPHNI